MRDNLGLNKKKKVHSRSLKLEFLQRVNFFLIQQELGDILSKARIKGKITMEKLFALPASNP